MKKNTIKFTNSIEPAAPASVWGKGAPGKGGTTTNSAIVENENKNENEKENG